jgi:alkaline phosphatase
MSNVTEKEIKNVNYFIGNGMAEIVCPLNPHLN